MNKQTNKQVRRSTDDTNLRKEMYEQETQKDTSNMLESSQEEVTQADMYQPKPQRDKANMSKFMKKMQQEMQQQYNKSLFYAFLFQLAIFFVLCVIMIVLTTTHTKKNSFDMEAIVNEVKEELRQEFYQEFYQELCQELRQEITQELKLEMAQQPENQETVDNQNKGTSTTSETDVSEVAKQESNSTTDEKEESTSNNQVFKTLTIRTNRDIFLYKKADYDSKVLDTILSNKKVTVIKALPNGWLKVRYNEQIGFIFYLYTNYVEKAEKQITVSKEYNNQQGYVNATNVNLRQNPGTTEKILSCLPNGRNLEILSKVYFFKDEPFSWYQVKDLVTGKIGYMYGLYVSISTTKATVTALTNNQKTETSAKEEETVKTEKETISNAETKKSTDTSIKEASSMKQTTKQETSNKESAKEKSTKKKATKKETTKKKATKKKATKKKTSKKQTSIIECNESNIELLAQVMTQEAGGCGKEEMGYVGQVLINRVNINQTDLATELARKNQYTTTWRLIQNNQVSATDEARKLAKKLLNGKNGFENRDDVPENVRNFIYFQGCNDGSHMFTTDWHRYAIRSCDAYLLEK